MCVFVCVCLGLALVVHDAVEGRERNQSLAMFVIMQLFLRVSTLINFVGKIFSSIYRADTISFCLTIGNL